MLRKELWTIDCGRVIKYNSEFEAALAYGFDPDNFRVYAVTQRVSGADTFMFSGRTFYFYSPAYCGTTVVERKRCHGPLIKNPVTIGHLCQ